MYHRPTRAARLAAAALAALLAASCRTTADAPPGAAAAAPDSVLLVSVDGLHPDRINPADAPNLARLAGEGVRARWMTPSYPSLTFPNHYTIATGLRPDRHGIVHNTMHDPGLGTFAPHDPDAVGTSAWWGGEPVWVAAEKAGMRTATLFWPGSEAEIGGVRPTRWRAYDESVGTRERAETVAGWLLEPAATRPRLATLYFHAVDAAAHGHGPDSPEARQALADVDAALGVLLSALERGGRRHHTNIVVVSDHGMAPVPTTQMIGVDALVPLDEARISSIGQVILLEPRPGFEARVEARVLGRHAHHECWRRGELPGRWHYGTHPRVPAIVCQMDEGWDAVLPRMVEARRAGGTRGSHGYDPALPSMRAVFIAAGPAFRRGAVLDPVDNVDVYPLLMRLLGLPPGDHDGDPAALLPALAPAAAG